MVYFYNYRIPLLKEIHNFIHLNLTIALFIALLIFVIGIELATGNEVREICSACTKLDNITHTGYLHNGGYHFTLFLYFCVHMDVV